MFAGVETKEVARRDAGPAAPAGELALTGDDIAPEADELAGQHPHETVLALDHAAELGRIEDLAGRVGIVGHGFESVDRGREIEFPVVERCEELHPEFDRIGVAHVLTRSGDVVSIVRSARPSPLGPPSPPVRTGTSLPIPRP